ncbi:biotin/lipoyl-containing protein [Sediminitomix flava]|uniref:Biotin-dependent enzyme n=1 Tax=Sediminitomix flava TaxID=379075 RepID=A0A315ZBN1_SEDFL|nr:biotin/lipoyl-containing protein [Sediminitomix flava]PWJ42124.1 biotin-dependent enzyme [Sediminitomix flava]
MKSYKFNINERKYNVVINSLEGNTMYMEVNGESFTVELEREVKSSKTPKIVRSAPKKAEAQPLATGKKANKIAAPLPGTILEIKLETGATVKRGDTILVMEAMKMENSILAESDGVIQDIRVSEGDSVMQGDVLVEIE